jgi:hypothetical protein
VCSVAAVSIIYFTLPLHPDQKHGIGAVQIVLFVAGLGALGWLAAFQVRRAQRPGRSAGDQISMLLTLVNVVVAAFATIYYVNAHQFTGMRTRLDALYFSIVTLGTVGYGDITPVSQAARAVVMVQVVFDLVIVTSAISIVIGGRRAK